MPAALPKDSLRSAMRMARSALSPREWARDNEARLRFWRAWLGDRAPDVLACYASRADEPGTQALIDDALAAGWRVLLPVLRREPDWAWFAGWGALRDSWGGIAEPTTPRLGAMALGQASIVVVPCLAVGLDGSRLGTGGGWYDRALMHRHPKAEVVALARAVEVKSEVPTEPHDTAVDAWVTEAGIGRRAPTAMTP